MCTVIFKAEKSTFHSVLFLHYYVRIGRDGDVDSWSVSFLVWSFEVSLWKVLEISKQMLSKL